ncbi:hypothetical protein [Rhodoplanes azumiensis]|uniref:Transposase n=1 Tax=Rhodoplanes azumiensis TaxID=1897628 RepID=A0ABW5AR77_9BRAD
MPESEAITSAARSPATAVPIGAPRGRGKRLPSTLARLATRDRLVRQWRDAFLSDASALAAAETIARELTRYRAAAWTRERTADECPQRHRGRPAELAWCVLKVCDRDLSARHIRRIIAT